MLPPPLTVDFIHPSSDQLVDKITSALAEKSSIQGFYRHVLQGIGDAPLGAITPLGTVVGVWPGTAVPHLQFDDPTSIQQGTIVQGFATPDTDMGFTVPVQTLVQNRQDSNSTVPAPSGDNVRRRVPDSDASPDDQSPLKSDAAQADSSAEDDFLDTNQDHLGGEFQAVEKLRPARSNEAVESSLALSETSSQANAAVFNSEGKWEQLNEDELLADKETEHSKSCSSYSSSQEIGALGSNNGKGSVKECDSTVGLVRGAPLLDVVGDVHTNSGANHSVEPYGEFLASSPLVAEGLAVFPPVYVSFVLSVPPATLQTLLALLPECSADIEKLAIRLRCNPYLLQGVVTCLKQQPTFKDWCSRLAVAGSLPMLADTVGIVTLPPPEILPHVETGTPHQVPHARPVSPPPFPSNVPASVSHFAGHSGFQDTASLSAPPARVGPLLLPASLLEKSPTTWESPSAANRLPSPAAKWGPLAPIQPLLCGRTLSPNCRIVDIMPNHLTTHTAISAKEPQTTILRTPGLTVSTTVEVTDESLSDRVATTSTRLDRNEVVTDVRSDFPMAGDLQPSYTIEEATSNTAWSPTNLLMESPQAKASCFSTSQVVASANGQHQHEWLQLSQGLLSEERSRSFVNMLPPHVLAESLRVLNETLTEYIMWVEDETTRRFVIRKSSPCSSCLPRFQNTIMSMMCGEIAFLLSLRAILMNRDQRHKVEQSHKAQTDDFASLPLTTRLRKLESECSYPRELVEFVYVRLTSPPPFVTLRMHQNPNPRLSPYPSPHARLDTPLREADPFSQSPNSRLPSLDHSSASVSYCLVHNSNTKSALGQPAVYMRNVATVPLATSQQSEVLRRIDHSFNNTSNVEKQGPPVGLPRHNPAMYVGQNHMNQK